MSNGVRPNGRLMTGAIGSFMNGAAFLIVLLLLGVAILYALSGARPEDNMSSEAAGGMMLLAFVLVLAGGICGGLGWFGYANVRGSTSGLAGIFGLLMSVALILAVVLGLAHMIDLLEPVAWLLFGSIALNALFGGIGLLTGKDRDPAKPSGGLAKAAGVILLVGGLGSIAMLLMLITRSPGPVTSADLLQILFYGTYATLGLGHILAGVSMAAARG